MSTATTTSSGTTTLADEVLDSREVSCPLPIIQTAQAMAGLSSGQTLLVMASDPGFEPDIKAWASRTGNPLISSERRGGEQRGVLGQTRTGPRGTRASQGGLDPGEKRVFLCPGRGPGAGR